jgi:acetyl esterase/lipase
MRCLGAMKRQGALAIEVDAERFRRFNAGIHQDLMQTVWNGCTSWYLDAHGRNSTNWPGFTLTYRWLTRHASLDAYRFSSPAIALGKAPSAELQIHTIAATSGPLEAINAALLRRFLQLAFRPLIGPPFSPKTQRRVVSALSWLMPGARGTRRGVIDANGVPTEVVHPRSHRGGDSASAVLYLHGGAFCLGSPATHRSLTTHLALSANMPVWVPDYRLAPEQPYPAALDDALSCYRAMLAQGHAAHDIVIAGDSAGGALALALALRLKSMGAPMPAALVLLSPVTDPTLSGATMHTHAARDPMLRQGWLEQALKWYQCPPTDTTHQPLAQSLQGLPPMLIQVGDQEILLADSLRLAEQAASSSVPCQLEIYAERWHVFQLQAFYLASARHALQAAADFASRHVTRGSSSADKIAPAVPRPISAG